jgi:hypothetical protein
MATTPVKHREDTDLNSADDMRKLGPIGMLAGAIIAILAIMAVVYAPKMWGIDPYGPDVTTHATAPATK